MPDSPFQTTPHRNPRARIPLAGGTGCQDEIANPAFHRKWNAHRHECLCHGRRKPHRAFLRVPFIFCCRDRSGSSHSTRRRRATFASLAGEKTPVETQIALFAAVGPLRKKRHHAIAQVAAPRPVHGLARAAGTLRIGNGHPCRIHLRLRAHRRVSRYRGRRQFLFSRRYRINISHLLHPSRPSSPGA